MLIFWKITLGSFEFRFLSSRQRTICFNKSEDISFFLRIWHFRHQNWYIPTDETSNTQWNQNNSKFVSKSSQIWKFDTYFLSLKFIYSEKDPKVKKITQFLWNYIHLLSNLEIGPMNFIRNFWLNFIILNFSLNLNLWNRLHCETFSVAKTDPDFSSEIRF